MPLEFIAADEARALDRALRVQTPVRPDPDHVAGIHHDQDRQQSETPAQHAGHHWYAKQPGKFCQ